MLSTLQLLTHPTLRPWWHCVRLQKQRDAYGSAAVLQNKAAKVLLNFDIRRNSSLSNSQKHLPCVRSNWDKQTFSFKASKEPRSDIKNIKSWSHLMELKYFPVIKKRLMSLWQSVTKVSAVVNQQNVFNCLIGLKRGNPHGCNNLRIHLKRNDETRSVALTSFILFSFFLHTFRVRRWWWYPDWWWWWR